MPVAPFLIGLAGSLHCIAMCGPLSSLVANVGHNSLWKRLAYNGGRIMTYGILGSLFTYLGGIASLFNAQTWLSLSVGAAFLIIGFTGIQVKGPRIFTKFLGAFSGFLRARFSVLLRMKTPVGIFAMGLLNGLLPCGMTWLALGYCATLAWPLDGFMAMGMFGLGTLPAMIGFSTVVNKLTTRFNISFKKLQTILLIASGCLLIARTLTTYDATTSQTTDEIVVCGSH